MSDAVAGVLTSVLVAALDLDGDFVGWTEVEKLERTVGILGTHPQQDIHWHAAGGVHSPGHPRMAAVVFPLARKGALDVHLLDALEAACVLVDAVAVEVGVFVFVPRTLRQVGRRRPGRPS
jgi:hypothetical protein